MVSRVIASTASVAKPKRSMLQISKSMLQVSWISSSFFIMRHSFSGERCGPWASSLNHLSKKLKWAFLITFRRHQSVHLPFRLSVNFSHFHLLLQKHFANFNQTLHKVLFDEGDSSLFNWRATPFPKGPWLWNSNVH